MASDVLPDFLQEQLRRFGIEIEHPTDLYASQVDDGGAHCRVTFHVVGKLLSGPSVSREDPNLGRLLTYKKIQTQPNLVTLAVMRARDALAVAPIQEDHSAGDLLLIDLRLYVPLHPSLIGVSG